nr:MULTISPECIES: mannosyltransferase family protein [unclassified Frigoribacterium]
MRLSPRLQGAPPVVVVLVLYALSRLVSSAWLGGLFSLAISQGWAFASHRADPSFASFSGSWDASFYRTIAQQGYPTELPVDDDGHVLPNPWAFLPVFPGLVRGVASVLGVELAGNAFFAIGLVVAVVAGGGAAVLLHRVVLETVGPQSALWAVALFCFGPLSFVLQVAYAESLMLLLTFAALLALVRRQYLLMVPFGVVAAFTRPGVLALALALAVTAIVRLRREGRGFRRRERVSVVVAGLLISAAGLAWPVIADHVTGRSGAYLDTELSWWVGFVGRQHFAPLTPWFVMAGTFLGVAGIVLVGVLLGVVAWAFTRRSTQAMGVEVVSYAASYLLYLVAVFLPQQSLPRLLLPVAPLLGHPVVVAVPRLRWVLLGVGVVLQPVAVVLLWFVGYP